MKHWYGWALVQDWLFDCGKRESKKYTNQPEWEKEMSVFWSLRQGRKWNIGFFSEGGTEIRSGGMTFTFLIWPRMETTKKGFESSPFVIDYVKKGSGICIQEQHFKVRMFLLLARISCVLGLITPSRILTRKVYCSKQELAEGHDRNLSFYSALLLSLKTKSRITHLSLLLLYCYAGEKRLL